MNTWRERAAPIIAEVIKEVGREDMKKLRRALREAYPFVERKYWPYKVWLSEIKRQLGHSKPGAKRSKKLQPFNENQGRLFDE